MPAPAPPRPAPAPAFSSLHDCRPGMVLAFTLVILTLMSLMGVTILLGSRTELNISSNTSLGRNALASADTAARIAVLVGRIILRGNSVDDVEQLGSASGLENPEYPLIVKVSQDLIDNGLKPMDHKEHYLRAGGEAAEADVVFRVQAGGERVVVATAAISMIVGGGSPGGGGGPVASGGGSLGGGDAYDAGGGGGAGLTVTLMVTANARAISPKIVGADKGEVLFFGDEEEPRSIVTILYRDVN